MRSSISSSEARFVVALAATFCALVVIWEAVLRERAGAIVEFGFGAPAHNVSSARGPEYVIFGNCLMMTGVSPRRVSEELEADSTRTITNVSAHEQSPIAFFEYLRHAGHYPDVIVTNVSSWLNGTNFEQEGELVTKADPLGLSKGESSGAVKAPAETFHQDNDGASGRFQRGAEAALSKIAGEHMRSLGHRYHLFDYALFVAALATSGDLDNAFYQLNMQSWFKVKRMDTDGNGFLGLDVDYREDWSRGLDRMAERSLQRLRLSRLLTPRYWSLLEDSVRHFESHGTQVLFVRMPEHPKIRAFNNETYQIPARLRELEERTAVKTLDLSELGPSDGVHLFDAVHPDAQASEVISRRVGIWLREQRAAKRGPTTP
jgi:hypothetical protein